MHIIQNFTLKKNVIKNFLPLVMALLQGTKNLFKQPTPRLADAGSRRLPASASRRRRSTAAMATAAATVDGGDGEPQKFFWG